MAVPLQLAYDLPPQVRLWPATRETTFNMGQNIELEVQGDVSRYGEIGLYDSQNVGFSSCTCNSFELQHGNLYKTVLKADAPPGNYEIRFLAAERKFPLAEFPITITGDNVQATITCDTQVVNGQVFTISYSTNYPRDTAQICITRYGKKIRSYPAPGHSGIINTKIAVVNTETSCGLFYVEYFIFADLSPITREEISVRPSPDEFVPRIHFDSRTFAVNQKITGYVSNLLFDASMMDEHAYNSAWVGLFRKSVPSMNYQHWSYIQQDHFTVELTGTIQDVGEWEVRVFPIGNSYEADLIATITIGDPDDEIEPSEVAIKLIAEGSRIGDTVVATSLEDLLTYARDVFHINASYLLDVYGEKIVDVARLQEGQVVYAISEKPTISDDQAMIILKNARDETYTVQRPSSTEDLKRQAENLFFETITKLVLRDSIIEDINILRDGDVVLCL
jgi:hypothetical protein